MGRLIKNHWARLITLTAAVCKWSLPTAGSAWQEPRMCANTETPDQMSAAIEGFFWPKILFDFLTKTLDGAVKPFPILQIINLVMGFMMLAWEYPLGFIAGSSIHRSLEARLAALPLFALASVLTYQGANAGLYYVVAMLVYFWAYSEGEVRVVISTSRYYRMKS